MVESKIRQYLGLLPPVIDVHQLQLLHIDDRDSCDDFLTKWHLQGTIVNYNFAVAAYYNGSMIGLTVWHTVNNYVELGRFATDITHGYTNLLLTMIQYFTQHHTVVEKIVSYSCNDYESGEMYQSCGFELSHRTRPQCRYTCDYLKLESKAKFQKHKLGQLFGISNQEIESKPVWELMQDAGYDRIWDSGKSKWILRVA